MNGEKIRWCAIGDSFTYLDSHIEASGYRITKAYLTRVVEQIPNLVLTNIGMDGSRTGDWIDRPLPEADLYTILLGTNDWGWGVPCGTKQDFDQKRSGTVLGNLGILIQNIQKRNPQARIIVMNPIERTDFVYVGGNEMLTPGSYAPRAGQWLCDISKAIYETCTQSGINNLYAVNLHDRSGITPANAMKWKRVWTGTAYENLPYPDYLSVPDDPVPKEHPYPVEAVGWTYDGLHPSDAGNQLIADILADEIKNIYGGI